MDIKIKREELMGVIKRLKLVEELPKQALQQYCRLLKLKQDARDHHGLITGFQERVIDIFCQEGQAFEDYLQLPKFRSMSVPLQNSLNHIFKTVWRECHQNRHKENLLNAQKQVEQLTTLFKTSAQSQYFHLGMLKLFRESPLCPRPNLKPTITEPDRMVPENNSFNSSGAAASRQEGDKVNPPVPYQCYPPFPLNSGSYPKVQPMEGSGYIMQKQLAQEPLFQVPRFAMGSPFYQQFFPNGQMGFPDQIPYQPHSMGAPKPPIKNIFGEDSSGHLAAKFRAYQFIQCVCEGKQVPDLNQAFRCSSCQYCYHYGCLRIEKATKEEVICPICNLRRETLFCKVVQEPIKFSWYLQEKNQNQFRLEMSEEESQQIIESKRNGLECQIRFLKIDGKSLRKEKRNMGFTTENGLLHKQVKHSEITLPQFSSENNQPIALDIMLRSQDDHNSSPKLYFFSVFLVILRKVDEIVGELFHSNSFVDESYLDQFKGEDGKVEARFYQSSLVKGLLRYPVRGSECNHPDVFDYEKFLELINDLKQDRETELLCPICSSACPGFKFDSFIYRQISQDPNFEHKRPVGIEVKRRGECSWIASDIPSFIFKEDPPEEPDFMENEEDLQPEKAKEEEE